MYINYEYYRVFYYAAKCGNLTKAAALLQNIEGVRRTLHTWLLPLGLLLDGRVGSWGALMGFLLLSLAPFMALVWGMSPQ